MTKSLLGTLDGGNMAFEEKEKACEKAQRQGQAWHVGGTANNYI